MQKRKKPINKCRVAFIICCCTLPILQWLIFYVYANFQSFTMAFTDRTGAFSLDNFERLWKQLQNIDSELGIAIKNTAITFCINVVLYPFHILVSYFLYKKIPGHGIYRVLFFLPAIIFSVAFSLVFKQLIGVNGFIAQGVQQMQGLDYTPTLLADSRYANYVIWAHMIWVGFAGNIVIYGGAFARIPDDLLESARLDGVNWWQEFVKIIIPMVWPTVALHAVMMFCGIFNASGQVFLLTEGKYGTMTLDAWMYIQILQGGTNIENSNIFNYMSAVGMVMTIIAVGISIGIRKWTDKVFNGLEY